MKTILIEEPGKVVIKEQEKPIRKPGGTFENFVWWNLRK